MNWENYGDDDVRILFEMTSEEDVELEHVEYFAKLSRLIASEQRLSDLFDENVLPYILETYGEDDTVAISEAFNNWSDSLCKDGEIHPLQYSEYCYVGRLAKN